MIRGNLPGWMTRLLGVEPAGSGQAVEWQLSLSWDLPPWVTLILVVAAVGFVVAVYRNENARASRRVKVVCMALRCGCLVWLLILLAQPVVQLQRTGLPGLSSCSTIRPVWVRSTSTTTPSSAPGWKNRFKRQATTA